MEYPNVKAIRQSLDFARDHPTWTTDDFIDEVRKVCDDAEHASATTDIQTIAKLQFIEKVLNG